MANRTVKDFEFPASFGFTGSGGKTPVKGYMRGGSVAPKKAPEARLKSPPAKVGWTDFKSGGKVKKAVGGPVPGAGEQAAAAAMAEAARNSRGPQGPAAPSRQAAMRVQKEAGRQNRMLERPNRQPGATIAVNRRTNMPSMLRPSGLAKGGKVHDDKAMDLKLIRSEISKAEKNEPEEMKRGGKAKKKGRRSPPKAAPMLAEAPMAPRGVPTFNAEPMIPMKRGGKSKC